jgi:anti-anti-sigma factor
MADKGTPRGLRAATNTLEDGVLTVTVTTDYIEANRGESIRVHALEHIEQAGDGLRAVVLDLGNVTYINSSGLGDVAQIATAVPQDVKRIALNVNPTLRESFHITKLDKLYSIVDDPADLATVLSAK